LFCEIVVSSRPHVSFETNLNVCGELSNTQSREFLWLGVSISSPKHLLKCKDALRKNSKHQATQRETITHAAWKVFEPRHPFRRCGLENTRTAYIHGARESRPTVYLTKLKASKIDLLSERWKHAKKGKNNDDKSAARSHKICREVVNSHTALRYRQRRHSEEHIIAWQRCQSCMLFSLNFSPKISAFNREEFALFSWILQMRKNGFIYPVSCFFYTLLSKSSKIAFILNATWFNFPLKLRVCQEYSTWQSVQRKFIVAEIKKRFLRSQMKALIKVCPD
jgi:hypothetical protein